MSCENGATSLMTETESLAASFAVLHEMVPNDSSNGPANTEYDVLLRTIRYIARLSAILDECESI